MHVKASNAAGSFDVVLDRAQVGRQLHDALVAEYARSFTVDCGTKGVVVAAPGKGISCSATDEGGRRKVGATVVDVVGADCDTEGANDTIDVGALCGGTSAPCDGPGISLAEAICAANVTPGPDTIELAPGATYEVPCTHNSWYGRNALPIITSEIVIEGNGARIERVSAGYCRFFFVAGACAESQAPTVGQLAPRGHLTLRHLTLANGWVRGGEGRDGGGGGAGLGGAIFNEGTLDVEGVLFLSNHAEGGHAVYSESHGAGGGLSGRGGNFRVGPLGLSVGFGGGFGGVNFGDGDFRIGGGFLAGDPMPASATQVVQVLVGREPAIDHAHDPAEPPPAQPVLDLRQDAVVVGVARPHPTPNWDPLTCHRETDHDLREIRTGVLRLAVPAELVRILGLEVGGGRVEEQQIHLEIEEIGDSEEHRLLHLGLCVGGDQQVHRPIRLI